MIWDTLISKQKINIKDKSAVKKKFIVELYLIFHLNAFVSKLCYVCYVYIRDE